MADGIYLPDTKQKYDFNTGFDVCCKTLRKRVRDDFDATIAVTGEEGISKSTLANHIGFRVDDKYTLEKNVLYSPNRSEMKDAITNLPRFSAVNADEAIKILYKLNWFSPMQIFLNTFYRLCRQENKISIFCMPRFSEFNEGFRNHRIILWIHIIDRGLGIAFEKDWSPFAKDPWWFDDNQKMIEKERKQKKMYEFSIEDMIRVFSKSKNYIGIVTFPDLAEELRIKYKTLSNKNKYAGMEEEYRESERIKKYKEDKKKLIFKLKEMGVTETDIGKTIGVTQEAISMVLTRKEEEEIF